MKNETLERTKLMETQEVIGIETHEKPLENARLVTLEQGSPEWLAWRNKGLGGSDIPAILGISQWATPLSIWAKKVGLDNEPQEENENMEWGHRLEPALVAKLMEHTGLHTAIRGPVYERTDMPWMRVSLDAILHDSALNMVIGECKAVGSEDGWMDSEGNPVIPLMYMAQGYWEMIVTGIRTVHFSVLVMGRSRKWLHRILEWNPDHIDMIQAEASRFWEHVTTNTAPPVSEHGGDADSSAIKAMFPSVDDSGSVEFGDEGEALLNKRTELKKMANDIDDAITAIENQVKVRMGSAKTATANGRKLCTASAYARESIDSKALKAAYPDIAVQFAKSTPVRTWRFAD